MPKHRGFTLIELLTVISIIGALVAVLLPAVQSAREAARRAWCASHLKQIGLGLHGYHDVFNGFPIGRTGLYYQYKASPNPNRRTWVLGVLPFVEQEVLSNAFNYNYSFYDPPNTTVIRTRLQLFQCPSDKPAEQEPATALRVKGNYVVNWGNTHYFQDEPNRGPDGPNPVSAPYGTVPFLGAPFSGNRSRGIDTLIDGASSTLLAAEVIAGQNIVLADHRGDIFNDDRSCSMFMTITTPNSRIPDQLGDRGYCGFGQSDNPPCNGRSPAFNAARSRHVGGVNALFGDGSARFIRDATDVRIWNALGSSSGGEVIGADSY